MKLFRFLLTLLLTLIFAILLENKLGSIPPLGSLLSPFEGFYQNGEGPEDVYFFSDTTLNGLTAPVQVSFDEMLVPHIKAENDADAYFVQGFLLAKFRLWQMEIQTHAAAGRLSEILGKEFLSFDREIRRQGLAYGAKNSLARMEQDTLTYQALNAFSQGVNAYIRQLDNAHLPIEYKLLDYQPEPWTPYKSSLLLKYMARDLTGRDNDLENTNLKAALGSQLFNTLFPDRLPNEDPIIPKGSKFLFDGKKVKRPVLPENEQTELTPLAKPDADNGSNNWAVAAKKTKAGHPILANDPHLGLSLPSLWYALQITTPTQNVYGVTLPGAPGIIIGFNENIAWGVTNAQRDVRDWYRIEFQDASRDKYRYEKQWLETQKREELIKIRPQFFWQGFSTFSDTVSYTHFGPVVYDPSFNEQNEKLNLALRWTAHDPSNELRTFLLLNRAKNYADFKEALQAYQTPAQNFAFASVQDTIALWVQGSFPAKWPEQGKYILEGTDARYEWQGFIPQDQNAAIVNPERGFVSSANQIPASSDYPYYIYDSYYEHYRNRRINQQLSRMRNIEPEDMMKLQLDNYHLRAAETLPKMLSMLPQEKLDGAALSAYNQLNRWDYQNTARSEAAALYRKWWETLNNLWWDEIDSLANAHDRPNPPTVAYLLVNDSLPPLTDIENTPKKESLKDLVQLSFEETVAWEVKWQQENDRSPRLEDLKNSRIMHPLKLAPFSITEMEVDGGAGIINANKGSHGPSWRMVVELSQPVKAWGVYPGGQSGNPGSTFYTNQVEFWRTGQFYPLYFQVPGRNYENKLLKIIELTP